MAIQAEKLRRTFGDFCAVDDISFEVPNGQIFGFLGPNGSGKTTTIRILLGLLPPSAGTAYVLGKDIRHVNRDFLQRVGYMSQKFSLYNDLTVEENLKFFGRSYGLHNHALCERIAYVLDMAGLKGHEHMRTGELAGGWAQRLALGAAIMHRPELVFLDEPTAGVDPVSRREFWDLLYELANTGTTIFVTTHYMDEAEHCESVAFISYGRIIAQGAPRDLVQDAVPGQVVAFEPPDPPRALALVQDAIRAGDLQAGSVSLFGAALHVITPDVEETRQFLQSTLPHQGITVNNLYITKPSLEDAFITLVQEDTHSNGKILTG